MMQLSVGIVDVILIKVISLLLLKEQPSIKTNQFSLVIDGQYLVVLLTQCRILLPLQL